MDGGVGAGLGGGGMPSIRKSASFRSRIPVRRTKAPSQHQQHHNFHHLHQRRCNSPPTVGNALTNSASVSAIRFPPPPLPHGGGGAKKQQIRQKNTRGSQKSVQKSRDRQRYSSTSSSSSGSSSRYSSSDESANSQDGHLNNKVRS